MKIAVVALLFFTLFACSESRNEEFLFKSIPSEISDLNFINELKESANLSILYYLYFYNGGGVAIGDINNDGLQDLFFTGNQVPNKLFLNKGSN